MSEWKSFDLQFFADGGAAAGGEGGDGAAAGVEAADAGRSRLEELGVPANKIREKKQKPAAPLPQGLRLAGAEPAGREANAEQQTEQQPEKAADTPETPKNEEPKRLSFEEISKDPEYKREIESLIRARLREESGAKAQLDKIAPLIAKLAERAGVELDTKDMMALDIDGANIQLNHSPEEVRELAAQLGTSQAVAQKVLEDRMRLEREQAANNRLRESIQERERSAARRQHLMKVESELRSLQGKYPGIDVDKELANPAFQRLTAPGVNVPVEDALWAIHRQDFAREAVAAGFNESRRRMTAAIQAANDRPAESGAGIAAATPSFDYTKLSREERELFKERIRQEAAAGRKIYPTR